MQKENTKVLRELLKTNKFLPVPSCYDALSAKLIEQSGFDLMFSKNLTGIVAALPTSVIFFPSHLVFALSVIESVPPPPPPRPGNGGIFIPDWTSSMACLRIVVK